MPRVIPSRKSLEKSVGQAVKFLRGVGTTPVIRAALETRGYSDKEHALGWDLVQRASGERRKPAPLGVATNPAVLEAIVKLDAWDEPNFAAHDATLQRHHPDQRDYLFNNLKPKKGAEAVVSVGTFVARVRALRDDPAREATRAEDHAALKLLAKRGLTEEVLAQLERWLQIARTGTPAEAPAVDPGADDSQAEAEQALVDLYFWLQEWRMHARAVITRRDYLIRLGLASRRSPGGRAGASAAGDDDEDDDGGEDDDGDGDGGGGGGAGGGGGGAGGDGGGGGGRKPGGKKSGG